MLIDPKVPLIFVFKSTSMKVSVKEIGEDGRKFNKYCFASVVDDILVVNVRTFEFPEKLIVYALTEKIHLQKTQNH